MVARSRRQPHLNDLLTESIILVDMHFQASGEHGILLPVRPDQAGATQAGAEQAGADQAGGNQAGIEHEFDLLPQYNALRRELWFLGVLVKKFKQPAPNQKKPLLCWEDQNWERELFDPLEPTGDIDPKKRFFDTVTALNQNHCHPGWLEFDTDGGEVCYWVEGPQAKAFLTARRAGPANLSLAGA